MGPWDLRWIFGKDHHKEVERLEPPNGGQVSVISQRSWFFYRIYLAGSFIGSKVWSLCGWKKRMDSPKKSLILAYKGWMLFPYQVPTSWGQEHYMGWKDKHTWQQMPLITWFLRPTMIHVDSFYVFLNYFWKKTEPLYLSHFNGQLNHFPSVDAMLHRCKALPEALLSRTCTVLGSAECSCEVVQSQSWSRVIVVSAAIDFSVVQLFSIFFPAIFWQLFNWLENRPVSLAGEPPCWPRLMFFQSAKWKIYENCNVW